MSRFIEIETGDELVLIDVADVVAVFVPDTTREPSIHSLKYRMRITTRNGSVIVGDFRYSKVAQRTARKIIAAAEAYWAEGSEPKAQPPVDADYPLPWRCENHTSATLGDVIDANGRTLCTTTRTPAETIVRVANREGGAS